jgi:hypothetical protein
MKENTPYVYLNIIISPGEARQKLSDNGLEKGTLDVLIKDNPEYGSDKLCALAKIVNGKNS